MARDETKMTAFENRLTTRGNAFGFARKFAYGKRICWTKSQCVNLVRDDFKYEHFWHRFRRDACRPRWVTEVRTQDK